MDVPAFGREALRKAAQLAVRSNAGSRITSPNDCILHFSAFAYPKTRATSRAFRGTTRNEPTRVWYVCMVNMEKTTDSFRCQSVGRYAGLVLIETHLQRKLYYEMGMRSQITYAISQSVTRLRSF